MFLRVLQHPMQPFDSHCNHTRFVQRAKKSRETSAMAKIFEPMNSPCSRGVFALQKTNTMDKRRKTKQTKMRRRKSQRESYIILRNSAACAAFRLSSIFVPVRLGERLNVSRMRRGASPKGKFKANAITPF